MDVLRRHRPGLCRAKRLQDAEDLQRGDAAGTWRPEAADAQQAETAADRRPHGGMIIGEVGIGLRSEEHTSELQSLMRISYAVFCLKKKKQSTHYNSRQSYTSPITS